MTAFHLLKTVTPLITRRSFVNTTRIMAGETGSGASRSGGERAGDAFTKREKGNEDQYIKAEEKNKLAKLREKLNTQAQHIKEMQKHIDDLDKSNAKESG